MRVRVARRARRALALRRVRLGEQERRQRRPPAASGGERRREDGEGRVRLPDDDDELRAGDGARREGGGRRHAGREADRVRAGRGQRAEAGAALPGRDAHVQGRRGDDDADARPVHPPAADRRASQNVPLVAVDVPPPKGTEDAVKLLIGNSNVEIGQDLAKALLPKIPEDAKGEILIGTDTPGLPVLEQRNAGLQGGHAEGAPGREVPRLRRQAEPDRQLQHLERAGQGAPGRGRLRRPGQPGRGVAVADPAQAGREEAARRRLRPRPGRDGGRRATATSRR